MLKCILIIALISRISAITFHFSVAPSTKECFDEHLPAHTLLSGEAISDFPMTFGIADDEEHLLFSEVGIKESHYSVTTAKSGKHLICAYNPNHNVISIELKYLRGIEAKDFSSLPKKKSLSAIDSKLDKLEKLVDEILEDIEGLMNDADTKLASSEYLGSKFIYSGIVTLIVLAIVAVFQMAYLKSYFRAKKLI